MANKVTDERPEATKDSGSPRVNFDNMRESKFQKLEGRQNSSKHTRKNPKPSGKPGDQGASGGSKIPKVMSTMAPYLRNPVVLESVSRVGVPVISGQSINSSGLWAVPGVMQIKYGTAPLGTDETTMVQAMNDQYSFTAHANSRNYNYSPEAMMTMELAGTEALALVALGIRAYGVMTNYEAMSLYTPKTLVAAMGFDFSDLERKYATMAGDINMLIAKTRQIWIPKTMTYFERWWKLNSEVYIDSENGRDQMYVFVPAGYRILEYTEGGYNLKFKTLFQARKFGDSHPNEGALVTTDSVQLKWADYISAVNEAIDALIAQQDRGMIYGDLLNAYGAANIISLDFFDANYKCVPIYDVAMLHEIMNGTLSTFQPTDINLINAAESPKLQQRWEIVPQGKNSEGVNQGSPMIYGLKDLYLNFKHVESVSPGEIVNATRFVTAGVSGVASATIYVPSSGEPYLESLIFQNLAYIRPQTCGEELMLELTVFVNYMYEGRVPATASYTTKAIPYYGLRYPANLELKTGSKIAQMQNFFQSVFDAFDWRPNRYVIDNDLAYSDDGQYIKTYTYSLALPKPAGIVGQYPISIPVDARIFTFSTLNAEVDNLYSIRADDLVNLNIACIQSMAGVPISFNLSRNQGKNMDRKSAK